MLVSRLREEAMTDNDYLVWRKAYVQARGEDHAALDFRWITQSLVEQMCAMDKPTSRKLVPFLHDNYCPLSSWGGRGLVCNESKHRAMFRSEAKAAAVAIEAVTI